MKLIDLLETSKSNLEEIKKFLLNPQRNEWVRVGTMRIYVRKGSHLVGKERILAKTFDIASVEQDEEEQRGKGEFRQFIIDLKNLLNSNVSLKNSIEGIYVESVLNDRLERSLPSMGFQLIPHSIPPCFYMKL